MTDKEFRRLKRAELVEIIYELQESEARLQKEVESLTMRLEQTEKMQTEEKLIAQAVADLKRMLLSAQSAAERYVEETKGLKKAKDSPSKPCKQVIHVKMRRKEKEKRENIGEFGCADSRTVE